MSTATLCERFRTKCLTNPLNLQLQFPRLEAVIVKVKKCCPETHDSQINSHLKRRLPSTLGGVALASSLCSAWRGCPVEQGQSITYSLSS